MKRPYLFDEFFGSGLEESVSPFLTPSSRVWGKNLSLKSGLLAAGFLLLALLSSFMSPPLTHLFLTFVYFLSGIPALIASLNDLKNLELNIDVLMTLAAFLALLIDSGLEGGLLLVLFELSHGMEEMVSHKALSALNHLNTLAPKFAHVVDEGGNLFERSVREIGVGTRLLIKNQEVVPLDGTVVEGSSSVNLVHLTGESIPVPKKVGDLLPAGARNLESALTIEVTRTNADSTLTQIIRLITEAQGSKPQLQRWLDRFGKRYAPLIIALTFLFAVTLPWLFSISYWGHEGSIYRSLAFLIAASPCALIIATPTAYLSAMSSCARRGILLKGGVTLDALASCTQIALDKTGTLTTGELDCTSMERLGSNSPLSDDEALSIAYGLERQVVHPIASAICKLAASKGLSPAEITSFQSIPGKGVQGATPTGALAFIGRPDRQDPRWKRSEEGEVLAILSIGEESFLFRFSDQVREQSARLISQLKEVNHLEIAMLTGDHQENADHVARLLHIDKVFAHLHPDEKLAKVAELSSQGALAMVGDGINDAPALARATVGISMGKIGSGAAVDASDVVLLNDELPLLSWLFSKARQTMRIVRQNLTVALSVICFATLPALLGWVPLWLAVILHEGGTVLVGLNSLRLLKK